MAETKDYTFATYTKIFEDDDSRMYLFDTAKFMKICEDNNYTGAQIARKIEEILDTYTEQTRSVNRVRAFAMQEIRTSIKAESFGIGLLKLLGKVLCKDEYAFLKEITMEYIIQAMDGIELNGILDVKEIYRRLYMILDEYDISYVYNYKPGTTEDGWSYYERRIQDIRREIEIRFVDKESIRIRFQKLTNEIEGFIKSYSVPGICDRWIKLHKELKFYDVTFDLYKEARDLYFQLSEGDEFTSANKGIKVAYKISLGEFIQREAYFTALKEVNERKNLKKSEMQWFKDELLLAFKDVFQNDFPEYCQNE